MKNYISKRKIVEYTLIDWLIKNQKLYKRAEKQFKKGFKESQKQYARKEE